MSVRGDKYNYYIYTAAAFKMAAMGYNYASWPHNNNNMKNFETTSLVPHEKLLHLATVPAIIRTRTHRQTAHAPYTRILGRAA